MPYSQLQPPHHPPNRPPIRLYLLDDHALFREGLLRLFEGDNALEVVGASGKPEEALPEVLELAPDILILDYDLGESTAVDFVRQLKGQQFAGRILLVTAGLPDADAITLIGQGVVGVFHKQQAPEALYRCIREVADGHTLISQEYLRGLIQSATQTAEPTVPRLTERDRQILGLLMEGLANKEIAAHLQVSESAVKASIQSLFAKTGVRTRSQLVRVALEKYLDQLQVS